MLQAKQEGGVDDIVEEIQAVLPAWEAAHPEGRKAKTTVKLSAREATEAADVETGIKKIAEGMTEEERYELLKDKKITVYPYSPDRFTELEKVLEKDDSEDLNGLLQGEYFGKGKALKLLKKIGESFSSFKEYENKDIFVTFEYSRASMKHSNAKQENGETLAFAKMLTVFDEVIDSAIGIKAHGKRYEYEKRNNSSFERIQASRLFCCFPARLPQAAALFRYSFTDKADQ